ncbi:chaplin family protein [Streptomyces netropsis]
MRQVAKKGLLTAAAASGVLAVTSGYAAHADSGAMGTAAHSPGVASGNTVQVPVHVPVNACGNTVNVVGLLNPASGNKCANVSGGHGKHGDKGHGNHGNGQGHHGHGKGGHHGGGHGSGADGKSVGSPGVASGNTVQVPVQVPVNACGNSVDVVGVGNPATGNECVNNGHARGHGPQGPGHKPPHERPGHPTPHEPPAKHNPPAEKPGHKPPAKHTPTAEKPGHKPAGHAKPPTEVKAAHQEEASFPVAKASELAHTGAGQLGIAVPAVGLLLGGAVLYRRARAAQG